MGNSFKRIFDFSMPKLNCKILVLGLDNSGKTTAMQSLKLGEPTNTTPTIGFNLEQFDYKQICFQVWDIGGSERLRSFWDHYLEGCRGLIFVVDSSDQERIDVAAAELNRIMGHEKMRDAVLLVLANKRDIATMNVQFLTDKLDLNQFQRNWAIFPVCAIKDESRSMEAAMEWLTSNIDAVNHPKKIVNLGPSLLKE